jgi:radical SAM protein with 4Fe4S-binding SPASM domain
MNNTDEKHNAERVYSDAYNAMKQGRRHEALDLFKKAFQYGKGPEFLDPLIDLSKSLAQSELWREAEESLLEVLRVDPDRQEAISLLQNLHSAPERFCDIKPYYDAAKIREKKRKTVISDIPLIQMFIEITNMCNGKCITCLNRSMRRKRGIMDFDLFRKIIDNSSGNMYLEMVHLYGVGEDYLVPDIKKYFNYAIKKLSGRGVETVLITNGELITDLHPGITVVDISFNGGKRETYERITGIRFDKTVRNIWRLEREGQLGANVNLHMLVFTENQSEVEDFKKLFAFTGANLVLAHKYDNQCGEIEDQTLSEYKHDTRIPCHYVRRVMNIAWNGDVILCPHDFHGVMNYGNVRETSLSGIWYGELHKEMLKKHSRCRFDGLCEKCNFNVPIEDQNVVVSRKERIELRKRYLDFALKEMIRCNKSSSCEIVRRYRDNIDNM